MSGFPEMRVLLPSDHPFSIGIFHEAPGDRTVGSAVRVAKTHSPGHATASPERRLLKPSENDGFHQEKIEGSWDQLISVRQVDFRKITLVNLWVDWWDTTAVNGFRNK